MRLWYSLLQREIQEIEILQNIHSLVPLEKRLMIHLCVTRFYSDKVFFMETVIYTCSNR